MPAILKARVLKKLAVLPVLIIKSIPGIEKEVSMYRSSNPTLRKDVYDVHATPTSGVMNIEGTVNKTFILTILILITAAWTWSKAFAGLQSIGVFMTIGAIAGLILALVTVFKQAWSPVTAPLYAIAEGLILGGLSAVFEARYPGIVIKAVALTFTTLASMLLLYKTKIIRPTEKFKIGILAATGGIGLVYLLGWILSFFKITLPIFGNSMFGIGFSIFVVAIAAFNLIIDFDFIVQASERRLPKYMEWYGAFALMVTLIWLYVEILRLLGKLNERR